MTRILDDKIGLAIVKNALAHAGHDAVAREIILGDSGTHFDPDVVEAFTAVESDFLEIRQRFSTGEPQMECDLALST